MVGPVSSLHVGAVGRVAGSGRGGSKGGAAMRKLAGRVASTLAREFELVDREGGRRQPGDDAFRGDEDLYETGATARALAADLGGGFADEGRLHHSLREFVVESASLIGARPEARSLEQIERAIAAGDGTVPPVDTVEATLQAIDGTVDRISNRRR